MPSTVLEDLAPRLKKAREAADDARDAYRLRMATLKRLVVQAVEEGMSQREVAKAAGYASAGRITAILADSGDDD